MSLGNERRRKEKTFRCRLEGMATLVRYRFVSSISSQMKSLYHSVEKSPRIDRYRRDISNDTAVGGTSLAVFETTVLTKLLTPAVMPCKLRHSLHCDAVPPSLTDLSRVETFALTGGLHVPEPRRVGVGQLRGNLQRRVSPEPQERQEPRER